MTLAEIKEYQDNIGKFINLFGYTSCSLDKNAAEKFAWENAHSGHHKVLFNIKWKCKVYNYYMNAGAYDHEEEVLLMDGDGVIVKSVEDVKVAFESGASQVTLGSIAVSDPETFDDLFEKYGSDKIILGADFLDNKIKTNGWLNDSGNDLMDFLEYHISKGIKYVIPTDISKDGMLKGPSIGIYKDILKSFKGISLIASGGISSVKDLIDLKEAGCEGAILGKAIYENKIELKSLMNFIETKC